MINKSWSLVAGVGLMLGVISAVAMRGYAGQSLGDWRTVGVLVAGVALVLAGCSSQQQGAIALSLSRNKDLWIGVPLLPVGITFLMAAYTNNSLWQLVVGSAALLCGIYATLRYFNLLGNAEVFLRGRGGLAVAFFLALAALLWSGEKVFLSQGMHWRATYTFLVALVVAISTGMVWWFGANVAMQKIWEGFSFLLMIPFGRLGPTVALIAWSCILYILYSYRVVGAGYSPLLLLGSQLCVILAGLVACWKISNTKVVAKIAGKI